jgi:hypothetical protein
MAGSKRCSPTHEEKGLRGRDSIRYLNKKREGDQGDLTTDENGGGDGSKAARG